MIAACERVADRERDALQQPRDVGTALGGPTPGPEARSRPGRRAKGLAEPPSVGEAMGSARESAGGRACVATPTMLRALALVAAAAVCAVCAGEEAGDGKQYPYADASSTRGDRAAANAFDGRDGTFWQSDTPAKDTWLSYERGEKGALSEVWLSNWIDVRYAAADGLKAFDIQASDDGVEWDTVLAVRDEPRWRAGETRKYYVDEGAREPRWAYRLVARSVPGRARGDSHVTLREVRFLFDDETTPACDALAAGELVVNVTAVGHPEEAPTVSTPNYEIQVSADISHLAGDDDLVSLRGLRVPILFSRGVRSWNGTWSRAPEDNFRVRCYGGAIEAPRTLRSMGDSSTDACERYLKVDVTESGPVLEFTGGTLCAGCTFRGADQGVVFALQHKDYLQMDAGSIEVLPPCSNSSSPEALTSIAPKPLPLPELHPRCAVFAADAEALACPPEGQLDKLNVTLNWMQPEGNASRGEGGPRELMMKFELYNTADEESISLAGVSVEFEFDRDVFVESFYEYVPAEPDEFELVCFWIESTLPNGLRRVGDVSACEYATFRMTENGVKITFTGAESICPGCFLTGPSSGRGPAFAVKHVSYFQLADQVQSPKALISCTPLSVEGQEPPSWCEDELSTVTSA